MSSDPTPFDPHETPEPIGNVPVPEPLRGHLDACAEQAVSLCHRRAAVTVNKTIETAAAIAVASFGEHGATPERVLTIYGLLVTERDRADARAGDDHAAKLVALLVAPLAGRLNDRKP